MRINKTKINTESGKNYETEHLYNGASSDNKAIYYEYYWNRNEIMDNTVEKMEGVRRNHGLSIGHAAVFVAAEMAGSGILALPKAVVDCGWIGFVLVVLFCFNAAYGGQRLGDCWAILEERFPEYRYTTRNPYPTIAFRAVGKWGRNLVSACIQLTLFGAGTVYLLIASRIIQELAEDVFHLFGYEGTLNFCVLFVVFAVLLCVPMWLGSPKDFWCFGILALLTTVISCILIFIQIVLDGMDARAATVIQPSSYDSVFLAFGTILFSFGGASTFPTIQNDMRNRNDFHKSVKIAFVVILLLYLPISCAAYFVYGESVSANVMLSLSPTWITRWANVFMAFHLILAFIIIINPVSQDLEEIFQVPKEFCLKRCILRTFILCLMVLIGLTIPKFDRILSLVGGSTVTLSTFVFPPLFYMILNDQNSSDWNKRIIPLYTRTYLWELIGIGIVGGIASTYSAVVDMIQDPFSRPCYLQN